MAKKKFHPHPACLPAFPFVKFLISIIEKKLNENYVKFDYRVVSVLVILSFF